MGGIVDNGDGPSGRGIVQPFGLSSLIGGMQPATVDKFGLPLNHSRAETYAEQEERVLKVIQLLLDAYDAAVYQLGEPRAQVLWQQVSKKKVGRPKGKRKNPDMDNLLLQVYDVNAPRMDDKSRRSLPRLVAEYAKKNRPKDFPVSVQSIETRVRRLLKDRETEKRQAAQPFEEILYIPNVLAAPAPPDKNYR
jgi:hypothetical protein